LFTDKERGRLSARLPGYAPNEVVSTGAIVDGAWHAVALVFDGEAAKLYVDGKEVADRKVAKFFRYPNSGPLTIGYVLGGEPTPGTVVDEVRISRIVRDIGNVPGVPPVADKETIALWRFDEAKGTSFPDESKTANPVTLAPAVQTSEMVGGSNRWMQMDVGPFFSSTLGPRQHTTFKAVSVKLGKNAAMAFDTEQLRVSAAWTGEFLKIHPAREGLAQPPEIAGKVQFSTKLVPGWLAPSLHQRPHRGDGTMVMPKEVGQYKGLYVHGQRVIFSHRVEGVDVLETYDVEGDAQFPVFVRTIHLAAQNKAAGYLAARLFDPTPGQNVLTRIVHAPAGPDARLKAELIGKDRAMVEFRSSDAPLTIKVLMAAADAPDAAERFEKACENSPKPIDLPALTRGGPASTAHTPSIRSPRPTTTRGSRSSASADTTFSGTATSRSVPFRGTCGSCPGSTRSSKTSAGDAMRRGCSSPWG
jgi:hypothetical protein